MNARRIAGAGAGKLFVRPLLVVVSVAFALGLAEGAIRLWVLLRHDGNSDVYNVWNAIYEAHPHSRLRPRPEGAFDVFGGRYRVTTDSHGFRSPEPAAVKPPNGFRIAFLGGSTTFNSEAPTNDHTVAARTVSMLSEARADLSLEALNAGTPGYTTMESLTTLVTRVLPLEPDLIVVYHSVNDAVFRVRGEYRGDYWQKPKPTHTRFDSKLYRWSQLHRFLTYKAVVGATPDRPPPATLRENLRANPPVGFERNLRSIVAAARAHDVGVVLCTFAYCRDTGRPDRDEWAVVFDGIDEQNEVVRRVAGEVNVPLFDVAESFPPECGLFTNQVHRTAEGLELHARLLTEFLLDRDLVPGVARAAATRP